MAAFTLQSLKNGLYPWPVYEAHFADGSVSRMSFWARADKPLDFKRGRALAALCGQTVRVPLRDRRAAVAEFKRERRRVTAERCEARAVVPGPIVAGFVCLGDGQRVPDPMTVGAVRVVKVSPKRLAADALALLRAGDHAGAAAALAEMAA